MAGKRNNYITWDEYFMGIVALSALRSNYKKEGTCIVDSNNKILATGYETVPVEISKNFNVHPSFALSSLNNAIYPFKGRRSEFIDGTVYLSSFPTNTESRMIAQAKPKKIVYLNKNIDFDHEKVSRRILSCANVELESYFDDSYSISDYKAFLNELKEVIKNYIGKTDETNLNDDEYFMGIVTLSACRSKDPGTQVGGCLVDSYGRVLSVGYNGSPIGMSDDIFPWDSRGEEVGDLFTTKDPYIIHAEMNTFDNFRGHLSDVQGGKLYLSYSPCVNCTQRIVFTGIEKVVCLRNYTKNGVFNISNKWLREADIYCELYNKKHDYTKEECTNLIKDTTKVIKRNLKR